MGGHEAQDLFGVLADIVGGFFLEVLDELIV
jgi:hypothetical protein